MAPIMTKIQKATPVSLKLMDLPNAGVAIRAVNPIINPANLCFFSLNTLHSLLLKGPILSTHFMCKRETKNQNCTIYIKRIFFCQYFIEIPFLSKLFRPFQESNYKTCKPGSERIQPQSPSKRPGETRQMATYDWTRNGSHPVKKSYPESYVAFYEFALWRSLRIMAWMVTGWIQDKNLSFLRKDIGVLPQKSNS